MPRSADGGRGGKIDGVDPFTGIVERARARRRRIVLPEGEDARVLGAAARLAREGVAEPWLLGSPEALERSAARAGVELDGVRLLAPGAGEHREACRAALVEALAGRDAGPAGIDGALDDPLVFAAALVRARVCDGVVAGAVHPTAETMRTYLRVIRPAPGVRLVSSFFLMGLREPTPGGEPLLAFADCGLVPRPEPDELAEIAWQTAHQFRLLGGGEPRVALLSFSTHGSAEHESVERVRRGYRALLARSPGFPVDGELQLDAAIVPEIARAKAPRSPLAGRANVLVFPDLDAGNIGYKLLERLGGARAVGPLLSGLGRPANDLSRGCSLEDVVLAAAVTALQAGADELP